MTDKFYKVDLFDTNNVSNEIKRLAVCFNLAAETYPLSFPRTTFRKAKELFEATTGKKAPTTSNDDERNYMRMQFLTLAAKKRGPNNPGWEPYAEALAKTARKLEAEAKKLKLFK